MKIGKIEINLKELLSGPPPQPEFNQSHARKNCDCRECKDIIMHDAYFIWHDSDHIETEEQLADAVNKLSFSE